MRIFLLCTKRNKVHSEIVGSLCGFTDISQCCPQSILGINLMQSQFMLFRTWIMTQHDCQIQMAQMVVRLLGERCHYNIRYARATHSRLLASASIRLGKDQYSLMDLIVVHSQIKGSKMYFVIRLVPSRGTLCTFNEHLHLTW